MKLETIGLLCFTVVVVGLVSFIYMPSHSDQVKQAEVKQANSNVHEVSVCNEMEVYIDKVNNVCWARSGYNAASIGFQISCDQALRCLK